MDNSIFTPYEADLHCHTTASDGLLTPTELISLAAELGLKGIGITDHDTIQGWHEAEEAGRKYHIQILRGIELSTEWQGKEVHILGYEIDASSHCLNDKLKYLRQARELRTLKILERLKAQGIHIDMTEVQQFAQGESVGRPHIAHALMKRGYVESIEEGFARFLGMGAPAYVPRYRMTPEEGIELVRTAHGVAVLAHPGVHHLEEGIPTWVNIGLQGIEVIHSDHNPEDVEKFSAIAEEYHLLTTGGSDFHGEAIKPGVRLGGWGASLDVIHQILDRARQNR